MKPVANQWTSTAVELMSRHANGIIEDIEPAVVRDRVTLLLLTASEHVQRQVLSTNVPQM